jgi:hypothetical protein
MRNGWNDYVVLLGLSDHADATDWHYDAPRGWLAIHRDHAPGQKAAARKLLSQISQRRRLDLDLDQELFTAAGEDE